MRTKKGDMVRVCFNGRMNDRYFKSRLSLGTFRVAQVHPNGRIAIDGLEFLGPVRSWVRCADLKEGGK